MKKLTPAQLAPLNPEEIIAVITGGIQFIDANKDSIKLAFDKIGEFFRSIGGPNSLGGRLKRIQALEAKDRLQKELNKLHEDEIKAIKEKIGL